MVLKVWDNGGSSFDRFTVRIGNDYYGMSENAHHAQGFNQYIGSWPDINELNLGKLITSNSKTRKYKTLPIQLRQAIINCS